jgi:hypothetical protein
VTDTLPSVAAGQKAAKPLAYWNGLPVYGAGQAPAHLRSRSHLQRQMRLTPAPGTRAVCWVRPLYHPDEPCLLYDPAACVPIPFRSAGDEWAWRSRRTCPRCGKVREYVVHGKQCGACNRADEAKRADVERRRCSGCRRVGSKPYPLVKIGFYPERLCRFCVAEKNRKREELLRTAIRCKGGCGKRTATKAEVLAWALTKHQAIARWERRCAPCQAERDAEQERLKAEREARWAKARAEQAERDRQAREARAREVADLAAWAAGVLADPDTVILDTETTGLEDDARIVDLAVVTGSGQVLLDTLINPGEPIPSEATDIHGITDAMVAGAPTFAQILPDLTAAVAGRRVVIYNDSYDLGRLRHELALIDADASAFTAAARWEDAMIPYSDWYGDWSDYWGNYSWQPLNGGHRALGDCRAVIDCLKAMARTAVSEEENAV